MKTRKTPASFGRSAAPYYRLVLYVAGTGSHSLLAIANIKHICERHLARRYQLKVVDLYQQPGRAKDAQIIAIPTLIREAPLPTRRIIGDLADTARVCAALDIVG